MTKIKYPCASIALPDDSEIKNPDESVIEKNSIKLDVNTHVFNPKNKNELIYEVKPKNGKFFTKMELLEIVSEKINKIYEEEEKSYEEECIKNPNEDEEVETKYGIWMHGINDLTLDAIVYNKKKDTYEITIST